MNTIYQRFLAVISYQLFGGTAPKVSINEVLGILKEAKAQTVFSTVFPFLSEFLRENNPAEYLKQQEIFLGNIIQNTNNFMEHNELHRLMTDNHIPYCSLKGIASAYYYPNPALREMGDVDFFVREDSFEKSKQIVLQSGFTIDQGDNIGGKHITFRRKPSSIWEQHRSYNTPSGVVGERIQTEIDRLIETSEVISLDGATCRIPDIYHHGLIMLLHVISHMTREGIGLRHLCDWAVFVNQRSNNEFVSLFKEKFKSYGLWNFAQILTMTSEKYLGINHYEWAQNPNVSNQYLESIMVDILHSGNFGKKDMNRYRETKYISNRGERTVDNKSIIAQVIDTLNKKVYTDYSFVNHHKIFLPLGWVAEGGKYIGLLACGKRKSKNTSAMLKEAAKRKEIYSKMKLFEAE